jgi:hypothetical protein
MTPRLLVLLPLMAGVSLACATASRDRGATGLFESTQTVRTPLAKRCAKHTGSRKSGCNEAEYLAQSYVRRLSVGENVCLEGGFGEPPGGTCLARALVFDTRDNEVLLDVKFAKPDSKWFHRESQQYWFEEGALVDLYLADHGY